MKLEDNRTAITGDFLTKQAFYDYFGEAAYIGLRHNYYFGPSPRALAFGLNGSEVMRINNAGNVGIGTTSPLATLHVARGTAPYGTAVFQGTTNWSHFNFSTSEDTYIRGGKSGSVVHINDGSIGNVYLVENGGNVGIGTTSPGAYKLYVAGSAYSTGGWQSSDIRFKKDLQPINVSLSKVLKLEGVSYEWKTEEYKDKGFPEGRHYGVIAQEIEKVLPEVVNTAPDGTKAVAYTEIIPVLIEAIKEQQKRIDLLEKRLEGIWK